MIFSDSVDLCLAYSLLIKNCFNIEDRKNRIKNKLVTLFNLVEL